MILLFFFFLIIAGISGTLVTIFIASICCLDERFKGQSMDKDDKIVLVFSILIFIISFVIAGITYQYAVDEYENQNSNIEVTMIY